jgi:hypothetical protein
VRDEDEFDVAGVVQPGGGPDPGVRVEPVLQPPLGRPAVTGTPGGAAGKALVSGLTGGGL